MKEHHSGIEKAAARIRTGLFVGYLGATSLIAERDTYALYMRSQYHGRDRRVCMQIGSADEILAAYFTRCRQWGAA